MKAFITLAVICLFASSWALELTEEQKAKGKVHFDNCVKQENVPEGDVAKLRSKDFANPSEAMKCFGACLFEQVGVLKDNKVQEDVAAQKLSTIIGEDKTQEVISKCKDVKGANRCETGHELFKCVSKLKDQILA